MASLDLKDAYYSVRIHPYFQKYLKFMYNGESLNTQFFLMVLPFVLENSLKLNVEDTPFTSETDQPRC